MVDLIRHLNESDQEKSLDVLCVPERPTGADERKRKERNHVR